MIKCRFEDGTEVRLRHVVVDVLLVEKHKILLVRRAVHLIKEPGKWVLPGGFVNRDETVVQAAVREAREETGYEVEIINRLFVVDDPNREERQNVSFVYLAKPVKQMGEPDSEVSEINWFELDKLPPVDQIGFDHLEIIRRCHKSSYLQ